MLRCFRLSPCGFRFCWLPSFCFRSVVLGGFWVFLPPSLWACCFGGGLVVLFVFLPCGRASWVDFVCVARFTFFLLVFLILLSLSLSLSLLLLLLILLRFLLLSACVIFFVICFLRSGSC